MNVKELKEKLNEFPDDARVILEQEGAYDIYEIEMSKFALDFGINSLGGTGWMGVHEKITGRHRPEEYIEENKNCKIGNGVVLS